MAFSLNVVARLCTNNSARVVLCQTRSFWSDVKMGPPDPILGLTQAFRNDDHPQKINLGVGAYRDDNGKPFVLDCVRKAEDRVRGKDHEYLGIMGMPDFNKKAAALIFGPDSSVLKQNRNVTMQSLSGTGSLRVAGQFLNRFLPGRAIYLSNPTWANHIPVFQDSNMETKSYRYYDAPTRGLDFSGMKADIQGAPNGSIVLLHACAHNPTGVDPTQEQWKELSDLVKEKGHFPLFDCAYQGFASGDCDRDAFAVRHFAEEGHSLAVCQSFAKNFGLYGQRVGSLTFVCSDEEEAARVDSQLKIVVRPMYSNPPVHGARLVNEILGDAELNKLWLSEVQLMANRIISMRQSLKSKLHQLGSTHDWEHITNQIGMFCFSGLSPEQVDTLREKYHIYMTKNGRISIAGITSGNIDHLAESIHAVTK